MPVANLVEALTVRYGQSPRMAGEMADGRTMLIFTSPSGDWTVLVAAPDVTACAEFVGTGFRVLLPLAPREGA